MAKLTIELNDKRVEAEIQEENYNLLDSALSVLMHICCDYAELTEAPAISRVHPRSEGIRLSLSPAQELLRIIQDEEMTARIDWEASEFVSCDLEALKSTIGEIIEQITLAVPVDYEGSVILTVKPQG